MNKQIGAITKLNLKNIKATYFIVGLMFCTMFLQAIIYTIIAFARDKSGSQLSVSCGNILWLLIILAAIFISAQNLRKIVNLGGKRNGFFWGSMATYTILAIAASLCNTLYYYTIERFFISTGYYISFETFMQNTSLLDTNYVSVNLIELFGWSSHGIFFAILQQFAFLLLLAAVTHTLTSIQDKWYGWLVDASIAAILAVFIPISMLRPTLLAFFNVIIFNSNAFLQIVICLVLAVVIYAFNKPILARKII